MGGGTRTRRLIERQLSLVVFILLFLTCFVDVVLGGSSSSFTPADNYLVNCGSPNDAVVDDGRTFKSDPQFASYLSTDEDILTSITSFPNNVSLSSSASSSVLPLYLTARIFHHESMYRFPIIRPGRHWIRLHFYPLTHLSYNLSSATFTITTDDIVLLHGFSVKDSTKMVFKEYLINITSDKLTLKFSPMKNSVAFVNAIELVSAPDDLISDLASAVSPVGDFNGLNNYALEVSYRLNVGGPIVTPKNDTLSRTWLPDGQFMVFPEGAKNVAVPTDMIQYPKGGATPLIAPYWVYATADQMADSGTADPNFNLTWEMSVDPSFSYLIRLHFCDIVSKGLNELYFNVYVNGITGVSSLDLSTLTSGLAIPYYKDFVLNASAISNGTVVIQVGPTSNVQSSLPNAILNGLEVMKLSNSAGSLDGLFSSDGTYRGLKSGPTVTMKVAAGIGLALGAVALLLLLIGILRWQKRPKGYEKQKTFSSWLLPLNSSQCSFLSSKSKSTTFSSIVNSGLNLGRYFTLNELRDATKNFDEKAVVGVGGFGKVYLGELEDGTKVAIKRGNPSSSQGINEFQTEIQLLSKLRHRHLVSLIGYCDEQSEMILVYEYMAYGPLRDHLYGSTLPPLSWRQRLEICIGAARGLHYLHTGSTQGIIHRDVKTTNILLDENFVAKVSDFGLSKAGPASLDQTHVSTAVKGSFGYLDPEYFRRQQLTEKSDVYSFGVVLFEVLCARPALDPALPRDQVNLAEFAKQQNAKGCIQKIIDPIIAGTITQESLTKYVEAAEKCLAEYGVDRPSMGDVLWHLESALQLQGTASAANSADNQYAGEDDDESDGKKIKRDIEAAGKSIEETRDEMVVDVSDDSGVVVASPMFLETFQGR
ncbi:probable receptor-like protein kinase At5g61350 [Sesamum indicum]|uniref:Probable receptor-like protein kinase At5g61350 n=1 Tax=Sesamum indicum TaxID=4182 RepID=A0A6I9U0I5_SESIN|nr:probable receptor-like protein kinase At5g61350 [Sesamum indicum]